MKRLTQAQRMQAYMAAAMYEVMELLEWDELRYNEVKFYFGICYIQSVSPFAHDREALWLSKQFWGWWKLQWHIREQEWLWKRQRDIWANLPVYKLDKRREDWCQLHNPMVLYDTLEDSYCRDLVKELR